MRESSSKVDSGEENAQSRLRAAYFVLEAMAAIVFVAALWWLVHSAPPDGRLVQTLLNVRLWIIVVLFSGWGTAGALVPYSLGQRGTKAVFDHYPRLEGQPWNRLQAAFQRWGALILILSGIPLLGAALLVAAGAFGVGRPVFLCWSFLGKLLRNWVFAFITLYGLQLLS